MKKDTLDNMCCPTCKEDLSLEIESKEEEEIITGILTCKKCKTKYKIVDGIADFLNKY